MLSQPKERRRCARSFASSALSMPSSPLLFTRVCHGSAASGKPSAFEGFAGENLVHVARRLGAARFADDARRNACHRLVVRYRGKHHRAGGDARAMANLDVAENFRAGADQNAVTDFGM